MIESFKRLPLGEWVAMWLPSLLSIPLPILAAWVSWLAFWPHPSPSRLIYQHPYFVSEPASSRDEVVWNEVFAARPGDVIYRWVEYCLDEKIHGEVHQSWVGDVIYPVPVRSTIGETGCHGRAIKMTVPHVPPGKYAYRLTVKYKVNPFYSAETDYPLIELFILPPDHGTAP